MTEPQRVTIYSAAYDRSPGASHRLLRQAAQLYAPGLAEPALASGAHGKPPSGETVQTVSRPERPSPVNLR